MENIVKAKEELYSTLRKYRLVVGAAIRGTAENQHIVIYLSRNSSKIKGHIPQNFKGNRVIFEVTGDILPLNKHSKRLIA